MGQLKVYLASSWRNKKYPDVLSKLEAAEFDVYDFRDPQHGFSWDDIESNHRQWTAERYLYNLFHPKATRAFNQDFGALTNCDALVLLHPCGRSAHLEAGYAAGNGKPVYVLIDAEDPDKADLMVRMCTGIHTDVDEIVRELKGLQK